MSAQPLDAKTASVVSVIVNYFNPSKSLKSLAILNFALEALAANRSNSLELIIVDGLGIRNAELAEKCWRRIDLAKVQNDTIASVAIYLYASRHSLRW